MWFTIDDRHSRDLDDALFYDPQTGTAQVAITAVAAQIAIGSPADTQAHKHLTTAYYAGGSRPMLTPELEQQCSLLPNQKTPCLVVTWKKGVSSISYQTIRSEAKLAYEDIPGILADKSHRLSAALNGIRGLALGLLAERRNKGALAFYDLNEGWYTGEEGNILLAERAASTIGHIIVQELMVLANTTFAEYAANQDLPILYRNHTARQHAPARDEILRQLDQARLDPSSVNALRARIHLVMNRANYHPTLVGHYGLALPAYTHATSPLRRYADLVTQRQLLTKLVPDSPPAADMLALVALADEINQRLNERELKGQQKERERSVERAEHQAEALSPERLAALSAKDFERLIKTFIRDVDNPPYHGALDQAVTLKLGQPDGLPLLDCYYLLFKAKGDDWREMRFRVAKYVRERPHLALSILALGPNLDGWPLEGAQYIQTPQGTKAKLPLERGTLETPAMGQVPSVKVGKQRAALALICALADLPLPSWGVPTASPKPDPSMGPINQLQSVTARMGLAPPEYSFSVVNPDPTTPSFTATVKLAGLDPVTGPPCGTKKEAKHAVAEAALKALVK